MAFKPIKLFQLLCVNKGHKVQKRKFSKTEKKKKINQNGTWMFLFGCWWNSSASPAQLRGWETVLPFQSSPFQNIQTVINLFFWFLAFFFLYFTIKSPNQTKTYLRSSLFHCHSRGKITNQSHLGIVFRQKITTKIEKCLKMNLWRKKISQLLMEKFFGQSQTKITFP